MSAVASGHRVQLFLDFEFDRDDDVLARLASLKLSDTARPNWIHPSRLEEDEAVADKPIWELREWQVSRDLHPFARIILDSRRNPSPAHPHCLELTQYAKNLVIGMYREERSAHPRRGIVLVLPRGSRVEQPEPHPVAVELDIEHVSLHLFRTGVAVAIIALALRTSQSQRGLSAEVLIEVLPRLCRTGRQRELRWRDASPASDAEQFGLSDLVNPLVSGAGLTAAARNRIYSLCSLTFNAPLTQAQREDTSLRLSRHYDSGYQMANETPGTAFVRPFANVLHAVSREGTCSIVDGIMDSSGKKVAFLADWLENSHRHVYLPLHLVALHQYIVLLRLGQGAGRHVEFDTASDRELGELTALCNRIRLFRLAYRLVQVSTITMHDLVYSAVEKALGIPELSEKIARDLMAVEPRLLELSAQRVERRYRWLTRVLAAGFAYLTVSGVGTHIANAISERPEAVPVWATLAIQTVSIVMAVVAFVIVGARTQPAKPSVEDAIGAAVD